MEYAADGRVEGLTPAERRAIVRRLRWLTRLLDTALPIPGTTWRFGADAVLGLIPGGGDIAMGLLSGYMIWQSRRLGAAPTLLRRMVWNVVLDLVVGAVPVLGDVFDVAFKANVRNLRLLEQAGLLDDDAPMNSK